jgi:hypothetical protein
MDVFAVQSLPRLTVTQNGDQSFEFNPRKPGTTMTYVNQRLLWSNKKTDLVTLVEEMTKK